MLSKLWLILQASCPLQPNFPIAASGVDQKIDIPSSVLTVPLSDPRPFFEGLPWFEELADCLRSKELLRYKFAKRGHINVLKSPVHKTWLRYCARKCHNSRALALLHSWVMLGATAKGRSSSKAICRVLQGSLGPYLSLYPGGVHTGSQLNRCDGPSRNRPVPPPSKEIPEWLVALRDHDFAGGA